MAQLNIEKISLSCKDREKEEKSKAYRRKTTLVLIYHYLKEYGCIQAANILESEVNFNIMEYSVCDNIHMESIIQDYESYYFLKYQRKPQIIRKRPETFILGITTDFAAQRNSGQRSIFFFDMVDKIIYNKAKSNRFQNSLILSSHLRNTSTNNKHIEKNEIKPIHKSNINPYNATEESNEYILEPLGSFEKYTEDWKCMAEVILQDMQTLNKRLHWDDIIGHIKPKELLKEAIIYPMKYKELFSKPPWRSILLYGPSGTGKTLLASVAASESGANFFKICISTVISKWRGESEKLMKVLFDLAKHYAPSIIFIDEIDALLSHRGDDHEASRRMKTEFFMQLDTLFSTDKLVLVLSATNMPWQLDYAILRRLEKRILISHPDEECRQQLFQKFLPRTIKVVNSEIKMNLDYQKLAEVTEKYSSSDIENACKEVMMSLMRQVINALECKASVPGSVSTVKIQALSTSDILKIMNKIKPTASELLPKYEEWQQKHGSE